MTKRKKQPAKPAQHDRVAVVVSRDGAKWASAVLDWVLDDPEAAERMYLELYVGYRERRKARRVCDRLLEESARK